MCLPKRNDFSLISQPISAVHFNLILQHFSFSFGICQFTLKKKKESCASDCVAVAVSALHCSTDMIRWTRKTKPVSAAVRPMILTQIMTDEKKQQRFIRNEKCWINWDTQNSRANFFSSVSAPFRLFFLFLVSEYLWDNIISRFTPQSITPDFVRKTMWER